jgi:hypothetical protein
VLHAVTAPAGRWLLRDVDDDAVEARSAG